VLSLTGLRGILAWWVVAFHFVRRFVPDDWALIKATVSGGHVAFAYRFIEEPLRRRLTVGISRRWTSGADMVSE
jgi:peptidoglycan/LPS O-acetylase OafA/YrhL